MDWYHLVYARESLYQVGRTLTWHEGVLRILGHVVEEREYYRRALHDSSDYESLSRFAARTSMTEHRRTVTEFNRMELTPELEFQIDFWSQSASLSVTEWVRARFPYTPEQFASYLDGCRPRLLQDAMDRPVLERRRQGLEVGPR